MPGGRAGVVAVVRATNVGRPMRELPAPSECYLECYLKPPKTVPTEPTGIPATLQKPLSEGQPKLNRTGQNDTESSLKTGGKRPVVHHDAFATKKIR